MNGWTKLKHPQKLGFLFTPIGAHADWLQIKPSPLPLSCKLIFSWIWMSSTPIHNPTGLLPSSAFSRKSFELLFKNLKLTVEMGVYGRDLIVLQHRDRYLSRSLFPKQQSTDLEGITGSIRGAFQILLSGEIKFTYYSAFLQPLTFISQHPLPERQRAAILQ